MLEALFSCFVLHFSIIFTRKALAIVRSPLHRSWYTKSINDCRSILSRSDILHTITACNKLHTWITDNWEQYITSPDKVFVYQFFCLHATLSHRVQSYSEGTACMTNWSQSLYLNLSPDILKGCQVSWLPVTEQHHCWLCAINWNKTPFLTDCSYYTTALTHWTTELCTVKVKTSWQCMDVIRGTKWNKNEVLRKEHKLTFLPREKTPVQVSVSAHSHMLGYKEAAHACGYHPVVITL